MEKIYGYVRVSSVDQNEDRQLVVMKEKNVTRILLEVRESNVPAKTLYENYGFSEIAVRKNYYTKPLENAIVMEKHI